MRRLPLLALVTTLGVAAGAAGCRTEAEPPPASAAANLASSGEAPPVGCGAALPGPPLAAGSLELDPVLVDQLASADPSQAPDPVRYGDGSRVTRALVNYLLGRADGSQVTHAEAHGRGELGRVVLAAASRGRVDLGLLRVGLHRSYLCGVPIPQSLEALVSRYGDYKRWESFLVPCSRAKDGPRRIYGDHDRGVFVAETIDGSAVRETEVIFRDLRTDGQLDFAVYTERGELTDRSTFATGHGGSVTSAAPFACMSCHFDRTSGTYSVTMPVGMGAGCQP